MFGAGFDKAKLILILEQYNKLARNLEIFDTFLSFWIPKTAIA
jgi:hypothetical protein